MTEQQFKSEMEHAKMRQRLAATESDSYGQRADPYSADYWMGVQRGLRRGYHGEKFGTEAEHQLWLSLAGDEDLQRDARGRGYAQGLQGLLERNP